MKKRFGKIPIETKSWPNSWTQRAHRRIIFIHSLPIIYQANKSDKLFAEQEDELEKLKEDIKQLCRNIKKFKIEVLLNKDEDSKNCYSFQTPTLELAELNHKIQGRNAFHMYLRFCEREYFHVDILDYQAGETELNQQHSMLKKKYATGFFKAEEGVHRLVRISPFNSITPDILICSTFCHP